MYIVVLVQFPVRKIAARDVHKIPAMLRQQQVSHERRTTTTSFVSGVSSKKLSIHRLD